MEMVSQTLLCSAPVPGGCSRRRERNGSGGHRSLCSTHRRYRNRGIPLDQKIGEAPVGRPRSVPRDGNGFVTACPVCGESRVTKNNIGRLRRCHPCGTKQRQPRETGTLPGEALLAYVSGESAHSIAIRIGCSPNTVLKRLRAAGTSTRTMSNAIKLIDHSALLAAADRLRKTGEMSRLMSAGFQGVSVDEWEGFRADHWSRVRASAEWDRWRSAVFSRDGYTCRFCSARDARLNPHHIQPKASCPERVFDVSNGITLCEPCHRLTFGKESEFEARCNMLVAECGQGIAVAIAGAARLDVVC